MVCATVEICSKGFTHTIFLYLSHYDPLLYFSFFLKFLPSQSLKVLRYNMEAFNRGLPILMVPFSGLKAVPFCVYRLRNASLKISQPLITTAHENGNANVAL